MKQLIWKVTVIGILVVAVLSSFSFQVQAAGKKKKISSPTGHKVTICHRTGSKENPYRRITISSNALDSHRRHGDIIPAPPGGCPTGL
ncbi:MAG TPA: hypothetical protein VNM22_08295 [Candidatus Limnocylindrales bacterium]|nr:hypothetical protein [Candidatus Limnocylindrales bacterium]